jgi:hypothetical protein
MQVALGLSSMLVFVHWLSLVSSSVLEQRSLSSYSEVDFAQSTVEIMYPQDKASYQYFGAALAINGNFLVVGAPGDNYFTKYGAASLYDVQTGNLVAKFSSDNSEGDLFGSTVAISGHHIAIGAQRCTLSII